MSHRDTVATAPPLMLPSCGGRGPVSTFDHKLSAFSESKPAEAAKPLLHVIVLPQFCGSEPVKRFLDRSMVVAVRRRARSYGTVPLRVFRARFSTETPPVLMQVTPVYEEP